MNGTRSVTLKGAPFTLFGSEIKVAQEAPAFKLLANGVSEIELSPSRGKARWLSLLDSVDAELCRLHTQWFKEEATQLNEVVISGISMDFPSTKSCYCSAQNFRNLHTFSEQREASFALAYGVLINEAGLLSRAFIIDRDGIVRYLEYVMEITAHPKYHKAIEALDNVATEKRRSVM